MQSGRQMHSSAVGNSSAQQLQQQAFAGTVANRGSAAGMGYGIGVNGRTGPKPGGRASGPMGRGPLRGGIRG